MIQPALGGPRVGEEIHEAWRWLLTRPQRVAAILASCSWAIAAVADILRDVEKICAHDGVDPADFDRHYDPHVTISAHNRWIIIELRDA